MKCSARSALAGLIMVFFVHAGFSQSPVIIYKSKAYTLYADSVRQGKYLATVFSPTEISTNYIHSSTELKNSNLEFRFSINGKDNELKPGLFHHFNCKDAGGGCATPILRFGTAENTQMNTNNTGSVLKPNTRFTVNVDLSPVFDAFEKQGYYEGANGEKIFKRDFTVVYIAGNQSPMIWDYNNLFNHPALQLEGNNKDHIYSRTITLENLTDSRNTEARWKLEKDISAFPHYKSNYPISDALYNLAMSEMVNAVEPDSTFRTGKEWAGVWTRDISYSIILSMAYLQPRVAEKSLLRKVNSKGRIIQDTGTGGAWPVSTDRMIWANAAWELYKVTGDKNWLNEAYRIIKNSLEDDYRVDYESSTGLVKGESSFLDWREETYPRWMQPADIFESNCLGTNAVHYQANIVLSRMAQILGDQAASSRYKKTADRIRFAINKFLWMPEKGYYGQYLYGRNYKLLSPRSEALGEALTVLFDVADKDKQSKIIENTPVMSFGIPCIYPQIPDIPPYHNNAVWPFVQAYWAMAAAKAGNQEAVLQSFGTIYRQAALWLTNKENFVASTGDYAGTQINSSNMLWSLSGSLALIHKVLFGIRFEEAGLSFHPFVPERLKGERKLKGFPYRKSILDIEMKGYGNSIKSFTVDGIKTKPFIPATLEGYHEIIIELNDELEDGKINLQEAYTSLSDPRPELTVRWLSWSDPKKTKSFRIFRNGKELAPSKNNSGIYTRGKSLGEYQIIAEDSNGIGSFASEPVLVADEGIENRFELENKEGKTGMASQGYSGSGYVEISTTTNRELKIPIEIKEEGDYVIDFRYANGNGPINTENKCAIRTLYTGGRFAGTFVFPQRGKNEWNNWGWSNSVKVHLRKGKQTISLIYEPYNENMNGEINQALLDFVRVIQLEKKSP